MGERIKSAIIGTGSIARAHVRATQEVRERIARDTEAGGPLAGLEIDLVAGMDVDATRAEAFARDQGIPRAYADVDRLLAETQPQLVHICTPPGPHTELIVKSLDAGAWVLCEKPLCGGLAEMDRIEDAERRTGNYCSSVVQQRFGSGAQHARALIQSGELGRPTVAICQTTWYRDDAYYAVPWHARWTEAFGGPVMTLGIHTMDLFLWLMGDFAEVTALADRLDPNKEVEDVSVATVRLESGALASVVNSVLSPRQETYLRLDFQRGTLQARYLYRNTAADWHVSLPDHPTFKATEEQLAAQERWRTVPSGDAEIPASQGTQLAALLEARVRGERPPASGPEARRAIEFISCLYKAAATRQSVARGSLAKDDPFYQRTYGTLPDLLG